MVFGRTSLGMHLGSLYACKYTAFSSTFRGGQRCRRRKSEIHGIRPKNRVRYEPIISHVKTKQKKEKEKIERKIFRKEFCTSRQTIDANRERGRGGLLGFSSPLARPPHRGLQVNCKNQARPRSAPVEILSRASNVVGRSEPSTASFVIGWIEYTRLDSPPEGKFR